MLNVICLIGRLVADPDLRTTPSGVNTTRFTIAVDRDFVKNGEERQADFIDIVCWRQTADFVTRYFRKGSWIAVNGSLQTHTYTDKNGQNRKAFEVVANNVNFCGNRSDSNNGGSYSNGGNQSGQSQPAVSYSNTDGSDLGGDSDDDLPF